MFEAEELHEFSILTPADDADVANIYVNVRFASDDGMTIYAEPLTYGIDTVEKMIKVTQDPLSRLVKKIVAARFTTEELRSVMETNPAFDMMPFDQPPVSQQTYQDIRI